MSGVFITSMLNARSSIEVGGGLGGNTVWLFGIALLSIYCQCNNDYAATVAIDSMSPLQIIMWLHSGDQVGVAVERTEETIALVVLVYIE